MNLPKRLPLFLLSVFGLVSCDSLKEKAVAILDESIEETGGQESSEGPVPGAAAVPNVSKLSVADFDQFTQTPGKVVVIDFYADRCGLCRQLAPVLEGLANGNDKVVLGKVDVDAEKALARREKVRGIPDVRIFVNGSQVDRFVGASSAKVARQRIEAQIGQISSTPAPRQGEPEKPKPEPEKPKPKPEPEKPKPAPEKPKPERQDSAEGEQPQGEQTIKPMEKDWLPPGVERK